MNANELADELDTTGRLHNWAKKAQAMLRQQQAEIEALKTKLSLWEQIGRQIANNYNQGTS
jgi:hypothetical protein